MRVALSGADQRLPFVSDQVLDENGARQVHVDMLDRLLGPADLRRLERMLHKKKTPTRSARRATPGPRGGSRDGQTRSVNFGAKKTIFGPGNVSTCVDFITFSNSLPS